MFGNVFQERNVLVTGHTGFKGTWLSAWLLKLGANVVGVSNEVPTQPAMFEVLEMKSKIRHIQADIRDLASMKDIFARERPDYVFHLAAQPIVSLSYSDPMTTMTTNVVGTLNVLEALRGVEHSCVAILITSDKCYDNTEWVWGYRETDSLGGKDVYSGSKGAAELVIKSYFHSFFKNNHPVKLAVGRAGNVIGGGDWAKDRIVVDAVRAWNQGSKVEIRSPSATRPWQHVLEPVSGYLALAQKLTHADFLNGEAFNFGPRAEQNRTVKELLDDLGVYWGFAETGQAYYITDNIPFHEAGLLKLNCDKSLYHLRWESNLEYQETIRLVGEWYRHFYDDDPEMYSITLKQLEWYESIAVERKRNWACL